jgi:glycerol-3-phosphate dehydrogenase (NAD(P)+)
MAENTIASVSIIGAGAFGTALALVAYRAGRRALLWARRPELAAELADRRENKIYLPGVVLDPEIRVTADPAEAAESDALLMVVPAQRMRAVAGTFAAHLPADTPVVSCAKGIEHGSLKLITEVLEEELPGRPLAVLSGPTFATEVARDYPAAATLAAADPAVGGDLVEAIGSHRFRPYLSDDPIGAQVGGAVKNVLAIACGIATGRMLGDSARAALITRGLAEIVRLGRAKGAKPETLMGLSGVGDLTLTCTAMLSRNYSLGVALGQGRHLGEILAERRSVAEGVHSAAAVVTLAERHGLEMPISQAVDGVLNHGAELEAALEGLLSRPFRPESA